MLNRLVGLWRSVLNTFSNLIINQVLLIIIKLSDKKEERETKWLADHVFELRKKKVQKISFLNAKYTIENLNDVALKGSLHFL